MLPMPTSRVPGYETGEDTTRYADWVEASALFAGERVSKSDVRDHFYEENTFQRGNADETVANIWSELARRGRLLAAAFPLLVHAQHVEPRGSWQDAPAYAFSLLLSYARSNAEWEHQACSDYQIQGQLFERVSAASLKAKLAVWDVDTIGWSAEHPETLRSQIKGISERLGEEAGNESPSAADKDGGVDVMCYLAFRDRRGDNPAIFFQCATGRNWTDKRSVSTINLWTNWISFKAPHLLSRGFAIPFLLSDDAFRQTQMRVDGLVLDRIRLFAQTLPESEWLPRDLKIELQRWVSKRRDSLIKVEL